MGKILDSLSNYLIIYLINGSLSLLLYYCIHIVEERKTKLLKIFRRYSLYTSDTGIFPLKCYLCFWLYIYIYIILV